jgi:hypothetical protein
MPSFDDRILARQSGRDPAQRPRLRAALHLEVLETRCLMSGWHPGIEHVAVLPRAVRGTDVTTHSVGSHEFDRRGLRPAVTQPARGSGLERSAADSDSGYGSRESWASATMTPNLPGLPRAAYVIVPETKSPHQTFATAQPLPDLPFFGVVGTTASGEPIDLYRLTLTAGAVSVDFGLVSDQPASAVPLQVQLFDGSGQVLGAWTVGGQGSPSLHAGLGGLPAGSTVYFGINAGNSSGPAGSSPAIDYQLWVSLQATTARAASAPGPGTTLSASGIVPASAAAPLPVATGLGVVPSSGDSQAAPAVPPNQGGNPRVTVGAPALRSAKPSEGLSSDGDPAPAVAGDFHVVVNKEWDEPSLTGSAPRPADGAEPVPRSSREPEPDALVVIPGPGGFPLLGALALGHRRRAPATAGELGDFPTTVDIGDGDRPDEGGLAAQGLLARSDNPIAAAEPAARSGDFHLRPWRGFPFSVFSALGLATVFTLNAVLSQPIAGFDYLTARLDARRGNSPNRKERLRRPSAAPR